MRLFVAIFPPVEVRESLHEAAKLLPVKGNVRWTPPSNVHLTLKFLGEVAQERMEEVGDALEEVAARHEPFEVQPSGFGAFPSARKARVVYSGVEAGADELCAIAEDVEAAFEPLGFEREERPYTPHVTLGRARRRPARLGEIEGTPWIAGFPARRLELVRSVLGEKGAGYSTVAGYPLTGRPRTEGRSP